MKKILSILAATLLIAGCSSPEDQFIGEWYESEEEITIVFAEDGALTFKDRYESMEGTYELLEEGEIRLEVRDEDGDVDSVVATYEFNGDTLSMTAEGDTINLNRVDD